MMKEQKQDPIYPTIRYWFFLHCKGYSIRIESDAITCNQHDDYALEKDEAYLDGFRIKYQEVKDEILSMIDINERAAK